MSPTWCKKRFYKRRGYKSFENKLFERTFVEKIKNFKEKLLDRGHPEKLIQRTFSEVNFEDRKQALQQKSKENKRILAFVAQFQPSVPKLKLILMSKWHLITNQPLLKEIFEEAPLISYKKGRSLQDILVKTKL